MGQDLIGQTVGHYRIIRSIEQGGMATVFLAGDIHLRREVAIKVFQPQGDQRRSNEVFRRFIREAQVVARLDHPNILLIHDYGEQGNLAYLVMPYLAKGSLKNLLRQRGLLPIEEALHLIYQLLDALQYAHDRGFIHRDIKPGNILFKNDQIPVLADFGLVKEIVANNMDQADAISRLATNPQSPYSNERIRGTPSYMAPEQILGRVQPQSDIYSIGLVLYEMLTGQLPFAIESQAGIVNILLKHLNEPPRPLAELNPNIPPQLARAVMRALEKEMTQRYQRPVDFLEALRAVAPLDETTPPASEGPLLLNRPGYRSERNAVGSVAPSDLHPLAALSTAKLPMHADPLRMHSLDDDVAAAPLISSSPIRHDVHRAPRRRRLYWLYSVLAAIVLAAPLLAGIIHFVGQGSPHALPTTGQRTTNHHPPAPSPTSVTQSSPMPATQTSCPPAGQLRAAVLAPYRSQGHNALVYAAAGQGPIDNPSSTLLRYDTMTGTTSAIITVPGDISEVELSADGQWVIFSTGGYTSGAQSNSKPTRLQMVRIDGQGLQTLYCSSPSDHLLFFSASPGLDPAESVWNLFFSLADSSMVGVMNIIKGAILFEFHSQYSYQPIIWETDFNLYLLRSSNSGNPGTQSSLVEFSFDSGASLPASDSAFLATPQVPSFGPCSDLDFSTDLRTIFTSQCKGSADFFCSGCLPTEGPSTIDAINFDTTSPKPVPIFTSSTMAIIQLRAITSSTLLFMVENTDQYSAENGLWKMNTDGTGLQRLFLTTQLLLFGGGPGYPWDTVSRDGSMYALKTTSAQAEGEDKLFIGSLNGGRPMTIAQDGVGPVGQIAMLYIAGWTTR